MINTISKVTEVLGFFFFFVCTAIFEEPYSNKDAMTVSAQLLVETQRDVQLQNSHTPARSEVHTAVLLKTQIFHPYSE